MYKIVDFLSIREQPYIYKKKLSEEADSNFFPLTDYTCNFQFKINKGNIGKR